MADFNGTENADTHNGSESDDNIYGNGGNDTLNGNGGNDLVVGGTGMDTVNGGEGNDRLHSHTTPNMFALSSADNQIEVDTLIGGGGNDQFFAGYGDPVDGGSGTDKLFINFQGATSGVNADFRVLASQSSLLVGGATIANIEVVNRIDGSNFADVLGLYQIMPDNDAIVYGYGGDDQILVSGYAGFFGPQLFGGDGNDTIDARSTSSVGGDYYGEAGHDTIYTDSSASASASGGDGNDAIQSHGEATGGAGNDLIVMARPSDIAGATLRAWGGDGDDELRVEPVGVGYYPFPVHLAGEGGADIVTGGEENDHLTSVGWIGNAISADDLGFEHDVVNGGGGQDHISIGYGDDADGGAGIDGIKLSFASAPSGVTFDAAALFSGQPIVVGGGTIKNFESVDTLVGSNFADTFTMGDQQLLTLGTTVYSGGGDDLIIDSPDTFFVNGGDGNDRFVVMSHGDSFYGGTGSDTVDYSNYGAGVTVTLGDIPMTTGYGPDYTQLTEVDNITGTAFADTLTGGFYANVLRGNGGDDTLNGRGSGDTLIGGTGNDTYYVYSGDSVTELAGEGIDKVHTAITTYTLGDHLDHLAFAGSAAATLTGNALANNISGGIGADAIKGALGNDLIDGGAGFDTAVFDGPNNAYSWALAGDQTVVHGPDGTDTLVGIEHMRFGDASFEYGTGFDRPSFLLASFGAGATAGGWANQHTYPRTVADVNGDGRPDLVGFAGGGVHVSLTYSNGAAGTPYLAMNYFGTDASAGGWSDNRVYPRTLADIDGDGSADLIGFGAAGVYAALANGSGGFGQVFLAKGGFGADPAAGGWSDTRTYPRLLADVNGDGMDDLVGFGDGGAHVSLATGGGSFAEAILGTAGFGAGAAAGGWNNDDVYTRTLADINGDGRADIVGFGSGGVHVALANANGTFANPFFAFAGFGAEAAAGGWNSNDHYYRTVGDTDGDGHADLVGFGDGGVYAASGDGAGGFTTARPVQGSYGAGAAAGGWTSQDLYPRLLADLNGDGAADIVGFGDGGVVTSAAVIDGWFLT